MALPIQSRIAGPCILRIADGTNAGIINRMAAHCLSGRSHLRSKNHGYKTARFKYVASAPQTHEKAIPAM